MLFRSTRILNKPMNMQLLGDAQPHTGGERRAGGGGRRLAKPRSVSIDVVIRKKISNIKAISAVELELIPGTALFFLAILLTSFFNC